MDTRESIRERILSFRDTRVEPVTGEGIPDAVFVGKLTVGQAGDIADLAGTSSPSAGLFVAFARDSEGNALFSSDDIPQILKLPAAIVAAVVRAGLALNGTDDVPALAESGAVAETA